MALGELARVLIPGGVLALATHLGRGEVVIDEFLGHPVSPVGGSLHDRDRLADLLAETGFRVEVERQRDPLSHEYDSRRLYLIARYVP